jgi:hypothetical protein
MSTENLQYQMTDDDRAKFERGAEMLKRAHAGEMFDTYWVPIGDGLLAIRRTVMNALHLKKASRSGYYNAAFGKLCAKTPYAEMHKVERSNLLYCMEHLSDITEMRAGWTPSERAKINHPISMAKRLKEFLNRAPTDPSPRRNVSPMVAEGQERAAHPRQSRSRRAIGGSRAERRLAVRPQEGHAGGYRQGHCRQRQRVAGEGDSSAAR